MKQLYGNAVETKQTKTNKKKKKKKKKIDLCLDQSNYETFSKLKKPYGNAVETSKKKKHLATHGLNLILAWTSPNIKLSQNCRMH